LFVLFSCLIHFILLKKQALYMDSLAGTIPTELGLLKEMQTLAFDFNQLKGKIFFFFVCLF